MAKGHWLDPLARKILRATGKLSQSKDNSSRKKKHGIKSIEKELERIKRKQDKKVIPITFSIDVNRASASDWKQLPGCTSEMIELLLRLQQGGVQLSGAEDLFQLLELPSHLATKWHPHLIFQWYGSPPSVTKSASLDLNSASKVTLQKNLRWPDARINRLIRGRQRRPFENLADLQERLALSPSIIEKLIGSVRFGTKQAGPSLPPKN